MVLFPIFLIFICTLFIHIDCFIQYPSTNNHKKSYTTTYLLKEEKHNDSVGKYLSSVVISITLASALYFNSNIARAATIASTATTARVTGTVAPTTIRQTVTVTPIPILSASDKFLLSKPDVINSRYGRGTNIPLDVSKILKDRFTVLRSDITGVKVGQLRVGDSIVNRLRAVDVELDNIEEDIFKDSVDWDVISVYPKILRAYSNLFTAYTDRAFPSDGPVDKALRYALRYEVGAFYGAVQEFEKALPDKAPRKAQRAFAKMFVLLLVNIAMLLVVLLVVLLLVLL